MDSVLKEIDTNSVDSISETQTSSIMSDFKLEYNSDDDQSVVVDEVLEPLTGDVWFEPDSVHPTIESAKLVVSTISSNILPTALLIRNCPYCDVTISSLTDLLEHINLHATDENYVCFHPGCLRGMKSAAEFFEHIIGVHMSELKLGCPICGELTGNIGSIKSHIDNHATACLLCGTDHNHGYLLEDHFYDQHCNAESKLSCTFCKYSIAKTRYRVFLHHIREHYGIAKYKCKLCGLWFDQCKGLDTHLENYHFVSNTLQCPCCMEFETRKASAMTLHWFHGCSKLRCRQCKNAYFTSIRDLYRHEKLCGQKEPRYDCNVCSCRFTARLHLQSHIVVHHDKTAGFPCLEERCGYVAPTKQRYDQHMVGCHRMNGTQTSSLSRSYLGMFEEVYRCRFPDCDFSGQSESELKTHVSDQHRNYQQNYPEMLKCNLCGVLVMEKYGLRRHNIYVHNATSKFYCNECDLYFRCKSDLKMHVQRLHNNDIKSNEVKVEGGDTMVMSSTSGDEGNFTRTEPNSQRTLKSHSSCSSKKKPATVSQSSKSIKTSKCPLCDYVTHPRSRGAKALGRHLFVHYRRGEKIPDGYTIAVKECPLCEHKAADQSHLRRHLLVHLKNGETLPRPYHVLKLKAS